MKEMPRKTVASAPTPSEADPSKADSTHKYNIIEESAPLPTVKADDPTAAATTTTATESQLIPTPTSLPEGDPCCGPPAGAVAAAIAAVPEEIQMSSPYQEMLKREYDHAVDQQIRKGIQAVSERFTRLFSQERNPTDVAKDSLGNTSDYYERIVNAYQSDNWQSLANTTEELYAMLFDLRFTEMRNIEAIKQEYNQQEQS